MTAIRFGREVCNDAEVADQKEWLLTNGSGSYASGTLAGTLTRAYHGLLVAATDPPGGRTLLVAKCDDTATYDGRGYALFTNRWHSDRSRSPLGCVNIESFRLDGSIAIWQFALADALIEKRVWMQPGADSTYVQYLLTRASRPLSLSFIVLVNCRDHHSRTRAGQVQFDLSPVEHGIRAQASGGRTGPVLLLSDLAKASPGGDWYQGFDLAGERERGLDDSDDHFRAATFEAALESGQTLTFVASVEPHPDLDGAQALKDRRRHDQQVLDRWDAAGQAQATAPGWLRQLVLAADQFIVERPATEGPAGKTVIAGYHWFGDWGRDTMISLPGLTLATGRPEVAQVILRTFAGFISKGMLPNNLPDNSRQLTDSEYNTVDATLWFVEAIRQYVETTADEELLRDIFPALEDVVQWHRDGTRYNIHLDPADGLLSAGAPGVQLTWMDARVNGHVITPRMGKPVEINALWYNALRSMAGFAHRLGRPGDSYEMLADAALKGFARFWNSELGYCFDVLDGPDGDDATLRPNQIFAISLPESPLTVGQQRAVVDVCAQRLLTSYGLRSLSPDNAQYVAHYGGDQTQRDAAYHQGTVWAWLLGPFALAHLRVYNDPAGARALLNPIADHLRAAGLGSVSEIFDAEPPFTPRGCIAQAWSVAEILRVWVATTQGAKPLITEDQP